MFNNFEKNCMFFWYFELFDNWCHMMQAAKQTLKKWKNNYD